MIIAYCPSASGLSRIELAAGDALPSTSVWIDLFKPTHEERILAEKLMGAAIPTREEMASIEASARLYDEPGAIVMTALLPMAAKALDPSMSAVTFVLSSKRLVTVRYGEPKSIDLCARKVQSDTSIAHNGSAIFFALLDIVVDRCADVMEEASGIYDDLSVQVFEEGLTSRKTKSYQATIKAQGRIGLRIAKMHDVCTSISRMMLFLSSHAQKVSLSEEQISLCRMTGRGYSLHKGARRCARQQAVLPSGRHRRAGNARAEPDHQDLLGARRHLPAADADRVRLRHELPEHAGTGMAIRLSVLDLHDVRIGSGHIPVLQVEETALTWLRQEVPGFAAIRDKGGSCSSPLQARTY
jgi:magnesium transporter